MILPFTLKVILRQKNNYANSKISPYKYITFETSSKRNQNPSRYYNTITKISSFNTSQNTKFKKSSYKNRQKPKGQTPFKLQYSIMNLNIISLPW
jgi:hypothetical protein